MQITTIALDIAKNAFQVHGIDAAEKVVVSRSITARPSLLGFSLAAGRLSCSITSMTIRGRSSSSMRAGSDARALSRSAADRATPPAGQTIGSR
jgi:hypothetical protein